MEYKDGTETMKDKKTIRKWNDKIPDIYDEKNITFDQAAIIKLTTETLKSEINKVEKHGKIAEKFVQCLQKEGSDQISLAIPDNENNIVFKNIPS